MQKVPKFEYLGERVTESYMNDKHISLRKSTKLKTTTCRSIQLKFAQSLHIFRHLLLSTFRKQETELCGALS